VPPPVRSSIMHLGFGRRLMPRVLTLLVLLGGSEAAHAQGLFGGLLGGGGGGGGGYGGGGGGARGGGCPGRGEARGRDGGGGWGIQSAGRVRWPADRRWSRSRPWLLWRRWDGLPAQHGHGPLQPGIQSDRAFPERLHLQLHHRAISDPGPAACSGSPS